MSLAETDARVFPQYFREVWAKLFPGEEWPATERIALTFLANEICMLRGMLEGMRAGYPLMQLREKVQWAHDIITHVIAEEELRSLLDEEMCVRFMDYVDAFCWVLKHDHGAPHSNPVGDGLTAIEMMLAIAGHGMVRTGKAKVQ